MANKYWNGTGWILADGTTTAPPGLTDTGILGGTLTGFTLPQTGTVSVAGLTPVDMGILEAPGIGPWIINGTGGVGDTIGNLIVPVGSTVTVSTAIAVKGLTIEPTPGAIAPAQIELDDGLPPGAVIDFPNEAVTYTTTLFASNFTQISVSAGGAVIANITVAGAVTLAGAATPDASGGTELTVAGTAPDINQGNTGGPYFLISVAGANDINHATGETVVIGDSRVQPNAYQGTVAKATSITNPATGLPYNSVTMNFGGSAALPDLFAKALAYDPTNPADAYEIQPWTESFSDGFRCNLS
jgi:hypothetical protein